MNTALLFKVIDFLDVHLTQSQWKKIKGISPCKGYITWDNKAMVIVDEFKSQTDHLKFIESQLTNDPIEKDITILIELLNLLSQHLNQIPIINYKNNFLYSTWFFENQKIALIFDLNYF